MKRFLWLSLTAILIVSCNADDKNNETLYHTYGVVKEDVNSNGKLYIRNDNGKILIPTLPNFLNNDDKDIRVWMLFFTDDNVKSDTVKANIYDFLKITNMDFKTQNDESKSDAVYLKKIWIAQDYLTLIMDVMAGSENSLKNHKYTMYSSPDIVNDTVYMEFKYDRNNDAINIPYSKIVTLKLDDKINLSQNSESVILAIKYLSNTNTAKETYVTYKK
jgi:hypothetical protein